MKKYYKELPENYVLDKTINLSNRRNGIIINVVPVLVLGLTFILLMLLKFNEITIPINFETDDIKEIMRILVSLFLILIGLIVPIASTFLSCIVALKLLTKSKLNIEFKASGLFIGSKEGYIRKNIVILYSILPIFIFFILFLLPIFILPANEFCFAFIVITSFNVCILIEKTIPIMNYMKYDKNTLIKDEGPTLYIYKKG